MPIKKINMPTTDICKLPKKDFSDYLFDTAYPRLVQHRIPMTETYRAVFENGFRELLDQNLDEDIDAKVMEFLTICQKEVEEYMNTCDYKMAKDEEFTFLGLVESFIKWKLEKWI